MDVQFFKSNVPPNVRAHRGCPDKVEEVGNEFISGMAPHAVLAVAQPSSSRRIDAFDSFGSCFTFSSLRSASIGLSPTS